MQINKTKEGFQDTQYIDAQICNNGPKNFNFLK